MGFTSDKHKYTHTAGDEMDQTHQTTTTTEFWGSNTVSA